MAKKEVAAKTDPRIEKLLAALLECVEKQSAIMSEIDALMKGKAGIGDKMKQFYDTWLTLWSARYRGDYVFAFAKDGTHLKRLLRSITVDELCARAANYLKSDDDFAVKSKHSFNVFIATSNQYAGFADADTAPVGCNHFPACKDDAACTKRKHREMLDGE